MIFIKHYDSPIGRLLISSDGNCLTGLWFMNIRPLEILNRGDLLIEKNNTILAETEKWLDSYFKGNNPDYEIPVEFQNGTEFQKEVWNTLTNIQYGTTATYGQIASIIAEKRGIRKMSAQAVGNAVGKNPISIIVPCHRVIGSDGSLTGYGWGMDIKRKLLNLEGIPVPAHLNSPAESYQKSSHER